MTLKAAAQTFPSAFGATRTGGLIDSGVRIPAAPSNLALPSVDGLPYIGQTLTANPGGWAGYPSPSFAYVWKLDGVANGATGSTYVAVAGDIGKIPSVTVSATNSQGGPIAATSTNGVAISAGPPITGSLAATEASDVFAAAGSLTALAAPVNTVAPAVTGSPNVGATLTASTGTWTGHPAPTYTYQWYWYDTVTPISGATSSTYVPVTGDVGHTISVNVTATNTSGAVSASSSATSAVANLAAPVVQFSPSARPAGMSFAQTAFIPSGTLINAANTQGAIVDASTPSPYASAANVIKIDGATECLFFLGDSLTEPTFQHENYPTKLIRLAYTSKGKVCSYKVCGYNGYGLGYVYSAAAKTTKTLNQVAAAEICTAIQAGLNNWPILFAGSNDIYLNGTTGAACWTLLQTNINALIAAGFSASKIIVVKMLKRELNTYETERLAYNSAIDSNAASMGYQVVDAPAVLPDQNDTTYFEADKTHLNDAGQAVLANAILGVIFP